MKILFCDLLFETGNGYRTALNGIYRKLATFDLYGSNLSWGLIDGWGLVYNLDKAPDDGGGRAMKKIATFSFNCFTSQTSYTYYIQ